jgi:N-acetylneuraminic acid mutarotase
MFWKLPVAEIRDPNPKWMKLQSWPGSGRFFAHLTGTGESLFLVGGASLAAGKSGLAERHFLMDAYEYRTSTGWRTLPNLPQATQAGVATMRNDSPLIFGGSDGVLAPFEARLRDEHPGFSPIVWELDRVESQWVPAGIMPTSLVTTGSVRWGRDFVIAGGEDRPGHRSSKVIATQL